MRADVSVERSIQASACARSFEMRKRAVVALTRVRGARAQLALIRALRDDSALVRQAAASALTQTPNLGRQEAGSIVRALRAQAKRERPGCARTHLERAASAVLRRRRNAGISAHRKARRARPDSPELGAVRRLKQRSAKQKYIVQDHGDETDDHFDLWWELEHDEGNLDDVVRCNAEHIRSKLEHLSASDYAALSRIERWTHAFDTAISKLQAHDLIGLFLGPDKVCSQELAPMFHALEAWESLDALHELMEAIGSSEGHTHREDIAEALLQNRPALAHLSEVLFAASRRERLALSRALSRCELTHQIVHKELKEPYQGFELHPGTKSVLGEVTADWLLEQGGRAQEFESLQRAVLRAPGHHALRRYKRAFYTSYKPALLPPALHRASLAWSEGKLKSAEVKVDFNGPSYQALLTHPSTAQLRSLDLRFCMVNHHPPPTLSMGALVDQGPHPLKNLRLRAENPVRLWIGETLSAFPELREFSIEEPIELLTPRSLQHRKLRSLRLPEFNGRFSPIWGTLYDARLPCLKRLCLGEGSGLEAAKVLPTILGIKSLAHLEIVATMVGALESKHSVAAVLPALRSLSLNDGSGRFDDDCSEEERSAHVWRLLTTGGLKKLEELHLNDWIFPFLKPSLQREDQLPGILRLRLDDVRLVLHFLKVGLNAPQLRTLDFCVNDEIADALQDCLLTSPCLPNLQRIVLRPDLFLSYEAAESIERWWNAAKRGKADSRGLQLRIQGRAFDPDVREVLTRLKRANPTPQQS